LTDEVVIVAARWAYPIYRGLHAYICQPDRTFRAVHRIGFYLQKAIMPELPRIERVYHGVVVTEEQAADLGASHDPLDLRLADLIRWRIADPTWEPTNDFYLLTATQDPATVRLTRPIPHRGEGPWTRGQRYASLDRLRVARTTADLD
jgi:hypothetical protein